MAIKDRSTVWARIQSVNMRNTRISIANSIRQRASANAPYLSGDLKEDGRVEELEKDTSTVVFGGRNVPYARRRNFENRKNPHTLNYLKRAAEQVFKQGADSWIKK